MGVDVGAAAGTRGPGHPDLRRGGLRQPPPPGVRQRGHAHGHLQFLEEVGDPATGEPIGTTDSNLKAAIAGETHEYTDMYPGMARAARDEGFEGIGIEMLEEYYLDMKWRLQ